jgi:hypothetical protein
MSDNVSARVVGKVRKTDEDHKDDFHLPRGNQRAPDARGIQSFIVEFAHKERSDFVGEASAFAWSGLPTVQIPPSVEMLCKHSLSDCTKRDSPMTLHLVGLPQLIHSWFTPSFLVLVKMHGYFPHLSTLTKIVAISFRIQSKPSIRYFIENAHDPDSSDSKDECRQ